jgi:deazaflavin-dependent oxidoreductase (nitroreductase family)
VVDISSRSAPAPLTARTTLLAMRVLEATNISVFRWSKGRVGGSFGGAPVILLTTSGHRTGARQTRPLLALDDRGAWIVVGAQVGTVDDRDWYENLLAYERFQRSGAAAANAPVLIAPEVEYWGDRRVAVRADVVPGAERSRWWSRMIEVYPRFEAFQARAPEHQIGLLRLTPFVY